MSYFPHLKTASCFENEKMWLRSMDMIRNVTVYNACLLIKMLYKTLTLSSIQGKVTLSAQKM